MKFSIRKKSQAYSPSFKLLNQTLRKYDRAIPMLLIDLDALDENIQQTQALLAPNMDFRIVVKSLPNQQLIDYIMDKMGTKKLMAFHQPILSTISTYADKQTDILLGKPMPIQTVDYYYKNLTTNNGFDPSKQLRWLVDTPKRSQEYIQFAKAFR